MVIAYCKPDRLGLEYTVPVDTTSAEDSDAPTSRRGRKRSEASRIAILTAAYELVTEIGYQALTIEGVAVRAGCGKQTLYRWWPHKADVLLEALAVKADLRVSTADHGSWQADLTAFLADSFELARVPGVVPVLRVLMAEAQMDSGFAERFRLGFLARRRAAFALLTDRALANGDLPDVEPDAIADIVFGAIWYRLLAYGEAPPETLIQPLVTLFTTPPEDAR